MRLHLVFAHDVCSSGMLSAVLWTVLCSQLVYNIWTVTTESKQLFCHFQCSGRCTHCRPKPILGSDVFPG